MWKFFIIPVMAMFLVSAPVMANGINPIPTGNQQVDVDTASESVSGVQINFGGSPTESTVHTTPDAYAPPVSGGHACAIGASIGGSVTGFGISAGTSWVDEKCNTRQDAALLHNMGYSMAALVRLCEANPQNASALFHGQGIVCPGYNPDIPRVDLQASSIPVETKKPISVDRQGKNQVCSLSDRQISDLAWDEIPSECSFRWNVDTKG